MNSDPSFPNACPPHQSAIRAKLSNVGDVYAEFKREEIEQPLSARFEYQVHRNQHRLAIKTRSDELTYDDLNGAANRLAWAIVGRCGDSSEPVVLLFEQGAQAVLAILGALKAGKFYVPIDVTHHESRANFLLEDCRARLIVTNRRWFEFAKKLAGGHRQVINVDDLDVDLPSENLNLAIASETLACVVYTSGSTGRPKGVMSTHRSVMHAAWEFSGEIHISPDDRLLLVPSHGASAATRSIFASLLNGAALFPFNIRDEGTHALAEWIAEQGVTIFHCNPPSVFRGFLGALDGQGSFPTVRLIRLAGDTIHRDDVELFRRHFSSKCVLLVALASSEAGSISLYFIDKKTQLETGPVPVGYPAADKEILMLDEEHNAVESGHVGEIAVRSSYLSPGYWGMPDTTQAVFLPDPEGGDKRIYRTGDLGQIRPDSCLVHLGRRDFQVKVRGYKVEPAEIESALIRHPAIEEAVVVAHDDGRGEHRLVAYVVSRGEALPSVTSLRRDQLEELPDYMIPSSYVVLESLPLTATGKVDRLALPPPSSARPELETPFFPPQSPVEETVADIWAEVLGIDEVGVCDEFLELGGHSLLASQLVSRIMQVFRVQMSVQSLLEATTVKEMALVIGDGQANEAGEEEAERILAELESLSEEQEKHRLGSQPRQLNTPQKGDIDV